MALSSQGPNSQEDLNKFSSGIENIINKIENPSLSNLGLTMGLNSLIGTPAQELEKRSQLLRNSVFLVNKPILKGLANDMISVMISWLDDPSVLCCLIQGIWAAYVSSYPNTYISKIKGKSPTLAESDFGKFIDHLITLIDLIIILMKDDIKRIALFIPDLVKEIYLAIMGAVLLLIQETLFALRDSLIAMFFEWMDSWDSQKLWSKCLPLKQFINVLKKYINDYGMLSNLMEKIKGFCSGWTLKFGSWSKELVPTVKDIEFLYWLRDLLIRLKRATINFDVCVDYEFTAKPSNADKNPAKEATGTAYVDKVASADLDNKGNLSEQQGYTIDENGNILVDRQQVADGTWVPRISNSFLRDFIHKEYGIPYEVIDNTITRGTSLDNIQGSVVTSNAQNLILDKCSGTPTASETLRWIFNMKSRLEK